jgi:F-type H+-transporting ATPase subunit b
MQINLTPDLSLPAIMVIFVINYLVVRRFFLKPINEIVEAREQNVRSAEERYKESLARFNEATAEMETRLHVAKRDAAQVREKFRAEAGAYRAGLVEKTTAEAKKMVSEAAEHLSRDVEEARAKITSESETLARDVAAKILGRVV